MSELEDPSSLYALEARCNAAESVRFLLEMCQFIRTRIEGALPESHLEQCTMMYDRAEAVSNDLRSFMFSRVVRLILPAAPVTQLLAPLKWDLRDLPETFNSYVTTLLEQLGTALEGMHTVAPKHVHSLLWGKMVSQMTLNLLEAYSKVKRCTNNGRAQMSLDLATFQRGIDRIITGTSSCPETMTLNGFIKAYYYDSASDFLTWLGSSEDMHGLALRHIIALVSCDKSPLAKLKRKKRQELRQRVEEVWATQVSMRTSET